MLTDATAVPAPRRHALALVLGVGLVAGVLMSVAWTALLSIRTGGAREVVIPAGTSAAITAGQSFDFSPERLTLPSDGTIQIQNQDTVEHRIGDTVIPAGGAVQFSASSTGEFLCTIHPGGTLEVAQASRPATWTMIPIALVFGAGAAMAAWQIQSLRATSAPPPA